MPEPQHQQSEPAQYMTVHDGIVLPPEEAAPPPTPMALFQAAQDAAAEQAAHQAAAQAAVEAAVQEAAAHADTNELARQAMSPMGAYLALQNATASPMDARAAEEIEEPPPLQPGWTAHMSPDGTPYFYHEITGTSSWIPPVAEEASEDTTAPPMERWKRAMRATNAAAAYAVAASALLEVTRGAPPDRREAEAKEEAPQQHREAPLLPGWTKHEAGNGSVYYHHQLSGESSWTKPVAPIVKQPSRRAASAPVARQPSTSHRKAPTRTSPNTKGSRDLALLRSLAASGLAPPDAPPLAPFMAPEMPSVEEYDD